MSPETGNNRAVQYKGRRGSTRGASSHHLIPVMDIPVENTHAGGSVELPAELWERIPRQDLEQSGIANWNLREDFQRLALVCRLLKRLCQELLFKELSLTMNTRMDYRNPACQGGRPSSLWLHEGNQWPVQEWMWEDWERGLRRTMRSERRLALIGADDFLAAQPRRLQVRGYELTHDYPADPFKRPDERQAVSRAVWDVCHKFGRTLVNRLPAFVNLRRLELCNYPVGSDLLAALESHQSLTELRFDFCWFPETTSPLTSITSISFGQIPGSHFGPYISLPGYEPYKGVPDHHLASAFDLISPTHVESLGISIGSKDSSAKFVLGQLRARTAGKGEFLRLHTLHCRFASSDEPPPGSLIVEFLSRMPTLRHLRAFGDLPTFADGVIVPARYIPLLETMVCPLDWMRVFVPGRPIKTLKLRLPESKERPEFLCHTEADLDVLLRPITLSTTAVTTLHLPHYPPVAPLRLLLPYLAERLPSIRDLQIAVAGECIGEISYGFRCDTRSGPPMPQTITGDQIVEDGLLEMLENEVKDDVDTMLATFPKSRNHVSNLPPVMDRIMAFRGLLKEEAKEEEGSQNSPVYTMPTYVPVPISPTLSLENEDEEYPKPQVSPLAPLAEYFCELDSKGVPVHEPETALDLLYFMSRGYYGLPQALQTLQILSCFENVSPGHHTLVVRATSKSDKRPPYIIEDEQYRLCTQVVLSDISQRYPDFSAFHCFDRVLRHRSYGRSVLHYNLNGRGEDGSAIWVE